MLIFVHFNNRYLFTDIKWEFESSNLLYVLNNTSYRKSKSMLNKYNARKIQCFHKLR
jgi:hypothetical protein